MKNFKKIVDLLLYIILGIATIVLIILVIGCLGYFFTLFLQPVGINENFTDKALRGLCSFGRLVGTIFVVIVFIGLVGGIGQTMKELFDNWRAKRHAP